MNSLIAVIGLVLPMFSPVPRRLIAVNLAGLLASIWVILFEIFASPMFLTRHFFEGTIRALTFVM